MPVITAPFLAAVIVLAASGVAKLRRPYDTARALRMAGLPFGKNWVRVGSVVEVLLAVAAVAEPGPVTGALVGAAYAAFAVFVATARRRGWVLASCGCFGKSDSRPTYTHAAVNIGAAAVAGWWSADANGHFGSAVQHTPWHGSAVGAVTLVIALLSYYVWTTPDPVTP